MMLNKAGANGCRRRTLQPSPRTAAAAAVARRSWPSAPRCVCTATRRPVGIAACCTAACVILVGCDNKAPPPQIQLRVARVVFVAAQQGDPTWTAIQAIARRFCREYRRAEVEVVGPETGGSAGQDKLLKDLIVRPVDAVCVVPADPQAVASTLRDLVKAGKRVVTVGRDVPEGGPHVFCGPSELELGQTAARACVRALRDRPQTILLLHAGSTDDVFGPRYSGFMRELRTFGDIRVLREMDCGGRVLDALQMVRTESHKYSRAGCWVFLDDWAFQGVPQEERLAPLGMGVVLCGASPKYFPRMRNGEIAAMIGYDFEKAVHAALFSAVQPPGESGEELPSGRFISPEIITIDNLSAYEQRWESWRHGAPTSVVDTADGV